MLANAHDKVAGFKITVNDEVVGMNESQVVDLDIEDISQLFMHHGRDSPAGVLETEWF